MPAESVDFFWRVAYSHRDHEALSLFFRHSANGSAVRKAVATVAAFLLLGWLSFAALSRAGQNIHTPEFLMGQALHEEQAEGNLESAIAYYRQVITASGTNRSIAARAQLHIGFCYERLKLPDALNAYNDVIDNYADQAAIVALASRRLRSLRDLYVVETAWHEGARAGFQPGVTIFEHASYGGAHKTFTQDVRDIREVPGPWYGAPEAIFRTSISSIGVADGWSVIAYELPDFDGASRRFASSIPNLSYVEEPSRSGDFRPISSLRISGPDPSQGVRPRRAAETSVVRVSGRKGWQYTEMTVRAGDKLTLVASGQISFSPGQFASPDGPLPGTLPGRCTARLCGCLLCGPDARHASLVATIGVPHLTDWTRGFFVGKDHTTVVSKGGRLYLGFNDEVVMADRKRMNQGALSDNDGHFTVIVTIAR